MSLAARFAKVAGDPDAPIGPHGETALHLAAQEGDAEIAARAIAAGATAFVMDRLNNSPLIYAASRNAADVIRVIVQSDNKGIDYPGHLGTALGIAAQEGNIDAARELLDGGANIGAADDMGSTPLMNAVYAEEKEMVAFLLERGADANALRMGEGALHLAVRRGNVEILEMLLASSAKQHLHQQTNAQKMTPLHIAVLSEQHAMAGMLIAAGAFPGMVNAQGETPLATAARKDDAKMIRLLVEQGHADLRQASPWPIQQTALHIAVLGGRMAAARELVRLGADPLTKDPDGRTALAMAREREDEGMIAVLEGRINSVMPPVFPKSSASTP
jgi:ankyrin repeat protein